MHPGFYGNRKFAELAIEIIEKQLKPILWVFGDSFTGMHHGVNGTESWMWLVYKSFVGNKLHISSKGSRDVQTIIDIFLRNLKDIKKIELPKESYLMRPDDVENLLIENFTYLNTIQNIWLLNKEAWYNDFETHYRHNYKFLNSDLLT